MAKQLRLHPAVNEVYYPKGSASQHIYEKYKLRDGAYGFMLSIRFKSPAKAIAFHDTLDVAKGPSLGTNFSLACKCSPLCVCAELVADTKSRRPVYAARALQRAYVGGRVRRGGGPCED